MASLARFEVQPAGPGDVDLSRRPRGRSPDLAAFRTLAEVDYARSLSTLIEREIIPRLMIAHADVPAHPAAIAAEEAVALVPLALAVEVDALLAHVDTVLARGVAVDTVMVELLAPTARLLGEYWEQDRCDFIEVTMGLWRLQEVVHELAARVPAERTLAAGGHRALFATMPGDQHSFGTVVIDEVFRRDGWVTDRMSEVATGDLLRTVAGAWFDLVGLTVTCDGHLATLPSIIVAMRNVSLNPRLCVMVGGRIFADEPALAAGIGADGTAPDARLALKVAADLVRVRERECLVSV